MGLQDGSLGTRRRLPSTRTGPSPMVDVNPPRTRRACLIGSPPADAAGLRLQPWRPLLRAPHVPVYGAAHVRSRPLDLRVIRVDGVVGIGRVYTPGEDQSRSPLLVHPDLTDGGRPIAECRLPDDEAAHAHTPANFRRGIWSCTSDAPSNSLENCATVAVDDTSLDKTCTNAPRCWDRPSICSIRSPELPGGLGQREHPHDAAPRSDCRVGQPRIRGCLPDAAACADRDVLSSFDLERNRGTRDVAVEPPLP